ncbi:MAG: WD40 repeat domain-containing protein [Pirellulales bacterium]
MVRAFLPAGAWSRVARVVRVARGVRGVRWRAGVVVLAVLCLAVSPAEQRLAAGGGDGSLRVWSRP